MKTEILSIGSELLSGDTVNTNAPYLSKQLAQLGIEVAYHSVVGDHSQSLQQALSIALNRSKLLIITGGLGPTYDDITKETVAAYFNLPLILHQPTLDEISLFFANKGKIMPDNNKKQAYIPQGSTVFANHSGTACGMALKQQEHIIILLPGPPRELKLMFETQVMPYLQSFSEYTFVSRTIRLFGIGESTVDNMLKEMMTHSTNPIIAPYAKEGEVSLQITAKASTKQEAWDLTEVSLSKIQQALAPYIYGIDIADLQTALVERLKEKKLTLATAESCTGGWISKSITDVPGSSQVYLGGVCAYTNQVKQNILAVQADTLQQFTAVSPQVALEMAQGALRMTQADFAISTTGIAGPDGGTDEQPVGLVYLCVAGNNGYQDIQHTVFSYGSFTSRMIIRELATKTALFMLYSAISQS